MYSVQPLQPPGKGGQRSTGSYKNSVLKTIYNTLRYNLYRRRFVLVRFSRSKLLPRYIELCSFVKRIEVGKEMNVLIRIT